MVPMFSKIQQFLFRPVVAMSCAMIVAFALKVRLMSPAATDALFIATLQHDSIIFASLLCLYALGVTGLRQDIPSAPLRSLAAGVAGLARLLCLLLIVVYMIDVFVFFFFTTRLYASDIVTFSRETEAFGSLVTTGWAVMTGRRSLWLIIVIAVVLSVFSYVCVKFLAGRTGRRSAVWPYVALAAVLAIFYEIPLPKYVYAFGDKPFHENLVERNVTFFADNRFSPEFRRDLIAHPLKKTCEPGSGKHLNIIVVLVESLSAYHSAYFSGIENWTPNLDAIARKETAFTNFHANGWTTIGGLVSLINGTYPIDPEVQRFEKWGEPISVDFSTVARPLPEIMIENGYKTVFMGAGDLNFLSQAQWLKDVGYQEIVGDKDHRFDRQKIRGPFNSVPDEVLFDEALETIDDLSGSAQPYFLTVQTFWSHRPFMAPDGSQVHDEEHVIRITDRQIGAFYERLRATDFFDNGLLFLTGDHRALEPYRKVEFERFGASAINSIPAILISDAIDLPSVIDDHYQQRDLKASLESLVSGHSCVEPFQGTFLGPTPTPPACIMHGRGDDRDLVFVKCGEEEGVVRLDGDATRLVDGDLSRSAEVIHTINYTRLRDFKSDETDPAQKGLDTEISARIDKAARLDGNGEQSKLLP
jgi:hypothetical protein